MKLAPLAAALGLSLMTSAAFAECDAPDQPKLPDGASATMDQMLDGQKAVKAFQAANLEYLGCLEELMTDREKAAKKADSDSKKEAMAAYNEAVEMYNTAVSAEETVAGQFNTEIREYKAANPG